MRVIVDPNTDWYIEIDYQATEDIIVDKFRIDIAVDGNSFR
jgi:hypothetical protein